MYAKTTTRQDVQNEDDEAVRVFEGTEKVITIQSSLRII